MSQGRKMTLIGVGIVVLLFIAAQLIPWGNIIPAFARTNPPVQTQIVWNSAETEQLVRTACYDCHSNETVWPWYTQITPISWLVARDVNEGRERLNLSERSADQIDPRELNEQINRGSMPPASYPILHPDAKLTEAQKAALIDGLSLSLHGTDRSGGFQGTPSGTGSGGEGDEAGEG